MIAASGNKELQGRYESAVEPPNVINPDTGVPDWYGSDDEAWSEFQAQM